MISQDHRPRKEGGGQQTTGRTYRGRDKGRLDTTQGEPWPRAKVDVGTGPKICQQSALRVSPIPTESESECECVCVILT